MALKHKTSLLAVLGLVLAMAGGWWWQNRGTAAPGTQPTAGPAGSAATSTKAAGPGPRGPGAAGPVGGGPGGPPAVEVGAVQSVTLVDEVTAVGSLRARQSVMLKPEVSGRVAQLAFRDGDRVRRGQLLVQLDDTLQKAQLQQAQAQANIAQTNLVRSRELHGQGFVSQSAVDQNVAALEVAQAQVALARAQLARMAIVAPFDAVTGIRVVNVGDYLKDGADIVTLDDLSSVLVDFRLPERYLPQLRAGLEVAVLLDALPGREFKGRIETLDAQIDANGRSLLVRAVVDNPGAVLKPGMFARPRVVFGRRESALMVPEEALVPLGTQQYLYIVADGANPQQKVARRVEARIGLRLPGKVELLAGAKAGDLVVTAGQTRLRGAETPVRVVDLSKPGAAAAAARPASAPPKSAAPGASAAPPA
jgi:membrane fusion protein (multidrug efflux system)